MTADGTADDFMAEAEKAIDKGTLKRLEDDATRCTRAGRWLFGIAIAVGIALLIVAYHLTGVYVDDLQNAKDPPLMLILLLVRGTLFGGLSVGFLYGIFTVGNAYVDQATRFRKRLYSAHMLNYAFETFGEEIKAGNKVKVDDLVRLFYAWNANVDSAFSRVAFQKASKNLVIGNGNQRIAVEDPPPKDDRHGMTQEGLRIIGVPVHGDWPNTRAPSASDEPPVAG
ncbi:MAG TPA: hypothetical protein VMR96_11260 [Solirubrobacterales bacterium]|nr:hypothetical protein [Solirubrobacterales bacterium]